MATNVLGAILFFIPRKDDQARYLDIYPNIISFDLEIDKPNYELWWTALTV